MEGDNESDKKSKGVDKKVLSFFMLGFPTVIIIVLNLLVQGYVIWIQLVVAIYQFVLLKQFIDNYYKLL